MCFFLAFLFVLLGLGGFTLWRKQQQSKDLLDPSKQEQQPLPDNKPSEQKDSINDHCKRTGGKGEDFEKTN